jgi:hypothetical protein
MSIVLPAILGRLLRPLTSSLRFEVLQGLAALQVDEADEARYHELADKNAEGEITPEESRELEGIVCGNTFLSLLRNEARSAIQER